MKLFKSQEEKQQIADAEAKFNDFVAHLGGDDPVRVRSLAESFEASGALEVLPARERRKLGEAAFREYASTVLADEHLTEDEETAFGEVGAVVGMEQSDFVADHDLYTRLQVAKLNAGRLPVVKSPKLMAKSGEVVYFETSAALMKEVSVRQWQGGSQGVSFRLAKGMRYHVGQTRGHMVTVGTQLQVADTGVLSITSTRAAYLGVHKTVEIPYARLMGIQMYSDAVGFSISNRETAPLFRVTCDTDVLGALLNAAMQHTGSE